MVWFFGITSFVLAVALGVAVFYLVRFTSYIIAIENDLSEAIAVHNRSINTFDQLLEYNIFFDSPEVQRRTKDILDDIKLCRGATVQVAQKFVRLSKHKYVTVDSDD